MRPLEEQAEFFFERLDHPVHTSYVDGCAAGLLGNDGLPVTKRWRNMVTNARVASGLNLFWCDKSRNHSLRFVLQETQHYPEVLVGGGLE